MPKVHRERPILPIMTEEDIDAENVSAQSFDSTFWKLHSPFPSISYITIIFLSPAVCGWMCVDMKSSQPGDFLWWLKGGNAIRWVVTEYLGVLCCFFYLTQCFTYHLNIECICQNEIISIAITCMSQPKFQTLCHIPSISVFHYATVISKSLTAFLK